MTAVPGVSGKMGNIKYFQCTMGAKDLVARTQNATNYFSKEDWDEMGVSGRMQRDVNVRYLQKIAPYLLRTKDRFFNSIVVLLDESLCKFTSLDDYTLNVKGTVMKASEFVPFDRQDEAKRIGFLEIKDKGHMLILDGQHRMSAIRSIVSPSDAEKKKLKKYLEADGDGDLINNDNGVLDDQYSVVFVVLDSKQAQRRLFADINSYANPIGQKERLFIAEDNGYYKIMQELVSTGSIIPESFISLTTTSLPDKSAKLTTGKHLAEIIEFVCREKGHIWGKQKLPKAKELEIATDQVATFLSNFFQKIEAYKTSLKEDPAEIVEKRVSTGKTSLLYKPLPQVALAQAIYILEEDSDLDQSAIFREINKIDWSYSKGSQFEGMVMTMDATILTGTKIQNRLKNMILFWVLGKKKFIAILGDDAFNKLNEDYQLTRDTTSDFPAVKSK